EAERPRDAAAVLRQLGAEATREGVARAPLVVGGGGRERIAARGGFDAAPRQDLAYEAAAAPPARPIARDLVGDGGLVDQVGRAQLGDRFVGDVALEAPPREDRGELGRRPRASPERAERGRARRARDLRRAARPCVAHGVAARARARSDHAPWI